MKKVITKQLFYITLYVIVAVVFLSPYFTQENRTQKINQLVKEVEEFYYQNADLLSKYVKICSAIPSSFSIKCTMEEARFSDVFVEDNTGLWYDYASQSYLDKNAMAHIDLLQKDLSKKIISLLNRSKNIVYEARNDLRKCYFDISIPDEIDDNNLSCLLVHYKEKDYIPDENDRSIENGWYVTVIDSMRSKPIGSDRFFEDRVYRAAKEYYDQNKEWLQDILEEGKQINSSFIYYPKSNEYIYEQVEKDIPNEEMIKIKDLARKVDTYLGEGHGQSTELTFSYIIVNQTGVGICFQLANNNPPQDITLVGWKNWFIAKSQKLRAELTGKSLHEYTIEGLWSVIFEIIDYV